MKKHKIDIKTIIIILCLIIFNSSVFFFSKLLLGELHLIGCKLDEMMPFIPEFIYVYIAWYVALLVVPYYVSQKNKKSFIKYIKAYIISTIICGIIFVIYPNTIQRATITGTGITNTLVKIIYFLDTPVNCLPSIHCLYAYLFILAMLDTKEHTPTYLKIIVSIFSIAVVLSTLFIKQHVIYDAIASLIIAITVWVIVSGVSEDAHF